MKLVIDSRLGLSYVLITFSKTAGPKTVSNSLGQHEANGLIYLDHHATTPIDPVALKVLKDCYEEVYANPGSTTHEAGRQAAERVDVALTSLAQNLGAKAEELVITSGATESNNLAILGYCLHPKQKKRKVVSLVTEHKAVLDPLSRLTRLGFEVELLPVRTQGSEAVGQVDLDRLAVAITDDTALVSVMLANNEIGVIQPVEQIAQLCDQANVAFHVDAAQAVGRIPVDVGKLGCDLLSFSCHKFYGPKGIGGLIVCNKRKRIRLQPQIVGGGQQMGLRSGTMNAPGIIASAVALEETLADLHKDPQRIGGLRDLLFAQLNERLPSIEINGPGLNATRLQGNLNCSFFPLEGQSLMLEVPEVAVSSGSACTSAEQTTSHVLKAIGLTEEQARSSIRFGVGRFTTKSDVVRAAEFLSAAADKLLRLYR